jgi:O-6-methylguanine DNA methyltransferase
MSTRLDSVGPAGGAELARHGLRRAVSACFETEWGEGGVTVRDGRLIAVEVPGDFSGAPGLAQTKDVHPEDRAALDRWIAELQAYFRGERLGWTAEEILLGELEISSFTREVYAALLEVPPAETVSYAGLAEEAGHPRAARAVGTAMATNPVPIVIPCHRVIKSDGSYGNYGKDPAYKVLLLEHERSHIARMARGQ